MYKRLEPGVGWKRAGKCAALGGGAFKYRSIIVSPKFQRNIQDIVRAILSFCFVFACDRSTEAETQPPGSARNEPESGQVLASKYTRKLHILGLRLSEQRRELRRRALPARTLQRAIGAEVNRPQRRPGTQAFRQSSSSRLQMQHRH